MDHLHPTLKAAALAMGFSKLTEIQLESQKLADSGSDFIARAPTGTGKTAAFLLPVLQRTIADPEMLTLVIEPSRELAIQAANECRKLSAGTDIRAVAAYGGTPAGRQVELIKAGAQVIIGTPGRLRELVQNGTIKPGLVKILVLDEADRLFGPQFIKDVDHLSSRIPKGRQTMMFCVQMPATILEHAQKLLKPGFLQAKSGTVAGSSVKHFFLQTDNKTKTLAAVILKLRTKSVVFCTTAEAVIKLSRDLRFYGLHPIPLHSQLESRERNDSVRRFSQSPDGVLVATDLAARGMHFEGVKTVYSFDLPSHDDFYLHRAGRTGRMGTTGSCISIVDADQLPKLKRLLSSFGIVASEMKAVQVGG